ncbi:peptidase U32 family protein [Gorillibacterium timonense]|uniref:peptidase U32 family protein n=1 Tax=Gorillibacterium timonense TaxID=1689269 RepID=UPI00071D2F39|nr:peptidase U32 family protein [Gorillibacterium timonense]
MANKPELITTAANLDELERVLRAGADAVAVGEERFGMRLPGSFDIEDIQKGVKLAHERGAKLYVIANALFTNEVADELPDYLRRVAAAGADALAFGDPALIPAMREAGVTLPLHWHGETLSTNYETANYWGRRGAVRVFAARELSLDELIAFKQDCALQVQVQVHGMTNIYHSKRPLVGLYREHQGKRGEAESYGLHTGLSLVEAERPDERFPVYEDANGTHIMSSDDLCYLEVLNELMAAGIDSLYVEGLLKGTAYQEKVIGIYRQAIDAWAENPTDWFKEEWLEELEAMQPDDRPLCFGFLYKQQVY